MLLIQRAVVTIAVFTGRLKSEEKKIIMPIQYYKLERKTPVACKSFTEWNFWMALATFADTTVMYNELNDCLISTTFVGIDLNPGSCNSNSQPMVFETLVMGGVLDGKKNLYPTWDEAIQGHLKICSQIFRLTP